MADARERMRVAHRLGIDVIAEGVGHGAQRGLLDAFEHYLKQHMALS